MLKCIMIENFSYLIQSIKKCMEYILFGPSVSCQNINYKTFCGKKQKKKICIALLHVNSGSFGSQKDHEDEDSLRNYMAFH